MNSEKEAQECLRLFGLEVCKIKESSTQTPDFFVRCNNNTYLVELKEKFTDKEYLKSRDRILLQGNKFEEITAAGRKKSISNRIREACRQLNAIELEADFKIVWLYAKGHHPDFQMYDFESTLFGREVLVDWGKEDGFSGFCYYYGHSDFFNNRNYLDGAIVTTSEEMKLCMNTCSPKYELLKSSGLTKAFGYGVLDPVELEKKGLALIVDTEIDRNDEVSIMQHLARKYALQRPMKMDMQQVCCTIALPPRN
jgi:hypothetical protein